MEAFGLPQPSPQLAATSYGRGMPYIDRAQYVEAQAELLPQLYLQKKQEEAFDERLRVEREARDLARRDANISLGMKGAELGYTAMTNPTLQRYGKSVLEALKPKPWQAPATTMAPVNYMQPIPSGGTPLNMPLVPDVVPIEMALPNADTFQVNPQTAFATASGTTGTAPVMTATETSSPSLMSKVTGYQGFAPFESGAANAGLQMGLGAAANYGIERSNMGEFMHKSLGGGEKEWNLAASSLSSLVLGGLPGLGVNLAVHGIKEFGKKNCIIVTACTNPDSEEVMIAKEFRDKFCTRDELRGYYLIADKAVPLIESDEKIKEVVKSQLVDRLISYARWMLRKCIEKPDAVTFAVVKEFRQLCLDIGSTRKTYTRANGEEV